MEYNELIDPNFFVGNVPIYGETILSPMDGYSNWPFRSICRELGSAISYTEFVNVRDILARPNYVLPKLRFKDDERPVAVQIYGDDPDQFLEAALEVQELGPDFIDINMGCPSKSISTRGAGVGLMRTPLKIARIFRKLSAKLEVPVTGKIRLGWDEDCLTYRLVSRIIEENGGQLLAVHGRTKVQGYVGEADWDAIAEVVSTVEIPVIGNGDIHTVGDIQRMMDHTGCAAVMIGRAAIENPWIFARLDRERVSPKQVREMILTHLGRNLNFYGPERGLVLFRKYAANYLSPYKLPKELRQKLLTLELPEEFVSLLEEIELEAKSGKG
jgi:nifR3 family TIM-barrel protein